MGVITAPFTATERRSLQLQIHNGPFDAVPVHDALLSSTLGRRTKRDKPKGSQDNPPPPPPSSPPPKDMGSNNNQSNDSGDGGAACTITFTKSDSDIVTKTIYHVTQYCKTEPTTSSSNFGGIASASSTGSTPSSPTTETPIPDSSSSITGSVEPEGSGGSSAIMTNSSALSSSSETLASLTSSLIPPSPLSVPTSSSSTEADANSPPASTSTPAARVQNTSKAGPIAGGVIGGLILILLFILGTILFLRRRRQKRTPASAEFRDRYIPRSHVVTPLAMQGSSEYLDDRDPPDAPPPPFTQGDYSDPLFEKIAETRQAHMQYGFTR
ncbi:uncharacterized protein FOMMEDRAFT_17979 [Fomitiporia mediterranea MF3/22]|uniref:uncharacterized protein n=1 Tax=Fomitiporia mediterranea (strain MF3/22) TaxID=694068 RepID=UPI00044093A7|nr:uncharacterized protein FOMMEDRAFT_17979 [Fomitiporia mediterranea MF3/22]EJD05747.1 hypothetical protein FOMMEDRAFT_17979 [Fomitiporia mediterranea MF3/22]